MGGGGAGVSVFFTMDRNLKKNGFFFFFFFFFFLGGGGEGEGG